MTPMNTDVRFHGSRVCNSSISLESSFYGPGQTVITDAVCTYLYMAKAPVTLIDVRMRSVLSTQVYVGEIEHFSKLCVCSTYRERMGNEFSVCRAHAVRTVDNVAANDNECRAYGLRMVCVRPTFPPHAVRIPSVCRAYW